MGQGTSKNYGTIAVAGIAAWAVLICFIFISNSQERLTIVALILAKRVFQIGLAGSIFLFAGALGSNILKITGCQTKDFCLDWLLGTGIGLGILGYLTFFLGVGGVFDKWIYVLILCAFAVLGLNQIVALVSKILQKIKDLPDVRLNLFSIILVVLLCIAALSYLAEALAPELEYDTLEYHFGALTSYLADGRIHFLKSNTYGNFPALTEMLYLTGMILEGDITAKLVNYLFGLLCVGAIICFCKKYFSWKAGLISGAVFYIYPLTGIVSSQAFIDLGLTFFTFMGLWAIINWFDGSAEVTPVCGKNVSPHKLKDRQEKQAGVWKWIVLAGVYCGLACSCKYTGLLFALGLIVLLIAGRSLLECIFRDKSFGCEATDSKICFARLIKSVVLLGAITVLVASPWYMKNYMATGNPFYPLLYKIFGGSNWDMVRELRFWKAHQPPDTSLQALVQLPWNMTTRDQKASLLFLFLLPLFVFVKKKNRIILSLAAFAVLFYLVWFYCTHHVDRFLMPVLPVLSIVCGWTLYRLADNKISGGILKSVMITALIFNIYIFNLFIASLNPWPVALGYETEDEFLSRNLKIYNAFKFLNDNLEENERVLVVGEARIHYLKVPFLANTVLDESILEQFFKPGISLARIKQEFEASGITHILLNKAEVRRLHQTYSYMADFDWNLFNRFEQEYLKEIYTDDEHGIIVYTLN